MNKVFPLISSAQYDDLIAVCNRVTAFLNHEGAEPNASFTTDSKLLLTVDGDIEKNTGISLIWLDEELVVNDYGQLLRLRSVCESMRSNYWYFYPALVSYLCYPGLFDTTHSLELDVAIYVVMHRHKKPLPEFVVY